MHVRHTRVAAAASPMVPHRSSTRQHGLGARQSGQAQQEDCRRGNRCHLLQQHRQTMYEHRAVELVECGRGWRGVAWGVARRVRVLTVLVRG